MTISEHHVDTIARLRQERDELLESELSLIRRIGELEAALMARESCDCPVPTVKDGKCVACGGIANG